MRISDWSSDVCSSDLCFYGSAMQSPRDHREMIEIAPMSSDGQSVEGGRITRAQLVSIICQRLDHLMGEIGKALKELGFIGPVGGQVEIGRASCRERVCQYG